MEFNIQPIEIILFLQNLFSNIRIICTHMVILPSIHHIYIYIHRTLFQNCISLQLYHNIMLKGFFLFLFFLSSGLCAYGAHGH